MIKERRFVRWDEEVVGEELVEAFTERIVDEGEREKIEREIMNTLEVYNNGTGEFMVKGVWYGVVRDEKVARDVAYEKALLFFRTNFEGLDREFLNKHVKVDMLRMLDVEAIEVMGDLLREYGAESWEELGSEEKKRFDMEVERRLEEVERRLREDPMGYLLERGYKLEDFRRLPVEVDLDGMAWEAVSKDGWKVFITGGERVHYTESGMIYFVF